MKDFAIAVWSSVVATMIGVWSDLTLFCITMFEYLMDFIDTPVGKLLTFLTGLLGVGVYSVFVWTSRKIRRISFSVVDFENYEVRIVRPDEIPYVHEFMRSQVGNAVSPLEHWQQRCALNSQTLFCIEKIDKQGPIESREIKGVFSVIPITRTAVELLDKNSISARNFTAEHICSDGSIADAIYVSILLGSDRMGKGMTLGLLKHTIQLKGFSGLPIFTRPSTPDGIRVAEKFGFLPVVKESGNKPMTIYRLG